MLRKYFIFMQEIDLVKKATAELSITDTTQEKEKCI